ncbi:MAG: HIT family protein [Syntrophomonadaceae bacterium]|nr:HIT family protein [Syntrophomonadaceae bacterium]
MSCPFCNYEKPIMENSYAIAIYDKYPVNPGHMLIIPKRHFNNYFEATAAEKEAIWTLVDECKCMLEEKYQPDGFNVGINVGAAAGQTIMHLHVHLIPRYKGDIDNPTGGVRGVIPEKRIY